nr:unnamed protein product [Callosobruchus analis]
MVFKVNNEFTVPLQISAVDTTVFVPSLHKGPIMDLAVTSHYLFGKGKASSTLKHLVAQFPPWTAVTYWTATYDSWII